MTGVVADLGTTSPLPWWKRRMAAFDLETTSPLPEEARIVTASVAMVGGGLATDTVAWLVDPGVEIPAEAEAIHGVSTERARAEGRDRAEVVRLIVELLAVAAARGFALVIFNARFDLTVLDRECRRLGIPTLSSRQIELRVVDPSVIDKVLDQYRRSYPYGVTPEAAAARGIPSSRTLTGMCVVYDATLDGAHDATFDAVAAARLAFRMGQRGEVIRKARNGQERAELDDLRREWASVRNDLDRLHAAQVRWALAERARFAEYKAQQGEMEDAMRIEAEVGWPVLDVMAHEEWAA